MSTPPLAPIGIQFHRLDANPLETNTVFPSKSAADAYAAGPTSYPGQEIKVLSSVANAPAMTFEVVTDGTNKTIKLVEAGEGGSGLLEETIVSDVNIGGIRAGDSITVGTLMTEVWQKLLTPAVHPEITSFTSDPAAGLQSVGTPISSVTLTAEVEKGSGEIDVVKIIKLPSEELLVDKTLINGGTATISDASPMDAGIRVYRCLVEGKDGLTATADLKFEFVCPCYLGSCLTVNPSESEIKSGTAYAVKPQNIGHSYTHVGRRVFGCFPDSWGVPLSIRDGSGLDVSLSLFTLSTVTIGSQTYNLFVFNLVNTLTDYILVFNFAVANSEGGVHVCHPPLYWNNL